MPRLSLVHSDSGSKETSIKSDRGFEEKGMERIS